MSSHEPRNVKWRIIPRYPPDLSAVPPWVKLLASVAILNWLVFFLIDAILGGTALGTLPDRGQFQLVEHGRLIRVSERTWLGSLAYSWLSLLLPVAAAWTFVPYVGRIRPARNGADPDLQVLGLQATIILGSA